MGGLLRFGLLMSWFVLVELCRVGATVWLSYWTGVTESGAGHMELQEAACHATVGLEPCTAACAVCIRQRLVMHQLNLLLATCHALAAAPVQVSELTCEPSQAE